ncbi:MAG: iron-sulfur cluster assembly accessory protein [Myxococcota bacterium]|nr:iron-sulfur cluster assembly accessory protein [Myxococcota bacterium]
MAVPLIHLTEDAVSKARSLAEAGSREGMAIRVTATTDGPAAFRYALQFVEADERVSEDTVVDQAGVVLYIDPESAQFLSGATIDFVDDLSGAGFKFENPNQPPLLEDPVAARVHQLIEERINPTVASHGGHVTLIDVKDGKVFVRLGGGCQGCGQADATLKQGIEAMIRDEIPEITSVLDTTDHAAGENPYYER